MVSIKTAKMNAESYFQSEDLQVKNTCKGGKFESISVTHGVATVGFNSDLSVSLGLGAFGVEGHIGIGLGVGLGQLSAGGSYTNKDKVIKGGDLTVRPGAGSVVAAAAAVATYFLPIIAF